MHHQHLYGKHCVDADNKKSHIFSDLKYSNFHINSEYRLFSVKH